MSQSGANKRKLLNFSVNRAMQLRMITRISLILFVSQILCGLIFLYFSNQEVTESFQMFHIKARNFLDFLWPVVLSAVVVSLVIGFFASLFFPKPIAGGLYRIEEDLKRVITGGDLTIRIKLRDGDQVTGLAQQVNLLLAHMQSRIGRSQDELNRLQQLCQQQHPKIEDLTQVHRELQEQLGSLKS